MLESHGLSEGVDVPQRLYHSWSVSRRLASLFLTSLIFSYVTDCDHIVPRQDVDTTGVEPLDTLLEDAPLKLRDDTPVQRATVEGMLRNAPETFEGFYVAPKELHFEQQHAESDDNSNGGNDDDSATATTTTTSRNNINKKGSNNDGAL